VFDQYLIQDSFIKKKDFQQTNLEIMLKFYDNFDPSGYENANRMVQEPTVIEDNRYQSKQTNLASNPTMNEEPLLVGIATDERIEAQQK